MGVKIAFDQFRIVVGRPVNRGRYFVSLEQIVGRGRNQSSGSFGVDVCAIEPQVERIRRHDDGHAFVEVARAGDWRAS